MSLPRITFLVDYPGWAFDYIARSIAYRLMNKYDFTIHYACNDERLDQKNFDLLYVFFWGEDIYKKYDVDSCRIIKDVASLRWKYEDRYGRLSVDEFAARYLGDCSFVTTPSLELFNMLRPHVQDLFHCPNGVETGLYRLPASARKSGSLKIGWVGNPDDASKGLHDVLIPAAAGYDFLYTNGKMSRNRLARFYGEIDVLAIASVAESQPLPLLESMSSGCFPVATRVGIVPELIVTGENGLVVERSVEAFRKAFEWCSANLSHLRSMGNYNRSCACSRDWGKCAQRFALVFDYALGKQSREYGHRPDPICNDNGGDDLKYPEYKTGKCYLALADMLSSLYYGDRYRGGLYNILNKRTR